MYIFVSMDLCIYNKQDNKYYLLRVINAVWMNSYC